MTNRWMFLTALASALGCGLVAGAFFAFSTFIMAALERLPPAQGIAVMKSINVTVINVWFMGALFGTAALCLAAAVMAVRNWGEPGSVFLLTGALLYLVFTILVTVAFNVPLNDRLAAMDQDSAAGATLWIAYVTNWTRWNHVRTFGAVAGMASFIIAIARQAQR